MGVIELTPQDLIGPLNETDEKHAPKKLYAAGDIHMLLDTARVSIVGSREASPEGRRRARKLAGILANEGVVVVSGLAKGIDTAAHEGALDAGGRTVAVIGTPLDKFYPRENQALQQHLMQDHLVISQFPVGMPTQRKNFPLRNRTMALISHATVIIEAGESSGSLSQGWEALRLGRALFIAHSVVNNPDLRWPDEMLSYGAKFLSDSTVEELLSMLPGKAPAELACADFF
jgi:DNA processing protein